MLKALRSRLYAPKNIHGVPESTRVVESSRDLLRDILVQFSWVGPDGYQPMQTVGKREVRRKLTHEQKCGDG